MDAPLVAAERDMGAAVPELETRLNYRHAYHAGNFADLVKHAALIALLERLDQKAGPLTVIDTHAGAGLYDLAGTEATRSGEAEAGIGRLLAAETAPGPLQALARAVRAARRASGVAAAYPGSPWLVVDRLGPGGRLIACELEPKAQAALRAALKGRSNVDARLADGFAAAAELTPARGAAVVLIDPPFERADDYRRSVQTVRAVLGRNRAAAVMVWLPLKDLETFDAFLRDLEDAVGRTPLLVAECRTRPLDDPLRMNGCALALVNPPAGLEAELEAVCAWTAALGTGGGARVWSPGEAS
jgi:23S rRNA (adenine2030-N6)-methyltransferase